ncbi:hypothetical protein [Cloacibacterium sp.]
MFDLLLAYGISKTSITFAFFQPHKARQKMKRATKPTLNRTTEKSHYR